MIKLLQTANGSTARSKRCTPAGAVHRRNPSALEVLDRFRETQSQLGRVLDEHGGVQGLVTLRDIFEAIVDELPSEGELESEVLRLADGSRLIDGGSAIDDVKEIIGVEAFPDEEKGYYETLAGLAMTMLGRIPCAGNSFEAVDLRFEVAEMDRLRREKALVKPIDLPDMKIS